MSELIRREDVMLRVREFIGNPTYTEFMLVNDLNALPSAEPERKKGEWRHLGGDEWCCTNCGYVVSTEGAWEHPKEQGKDYCEHCGSDMRSEYE